MSETSFYILLYVMAILSVAVYIALHFVKAGYGKFRTKSWGISVNNKSGWVLMEAPVFIVVLLYWSQSPVRFQPLPLIGFLLFELHYFQRSFVFPFLLKGHSRMPLVVIGMGIVFNLVNGIMQSEWLFHFAPAAESSWFYSVPFMAGSVLFLSGLFINWHSDAVIRHLRRPGDNRHYLPEKGLYRYVTSANYFGELVEWTGFALLTTSPAGWVFVLWTFANLAPRANAIYKNYVKEFGKEQVGTRKRLFPFIY